MIELSDIEFERTGRTADRWNESMTGEGNR